MAEDPLNVEPIELRSAFALGRRTGACPAKVWRLVVRSYASFALALLDRLIAFLSAGSGSLGAAGVVAMMLLITANVVLRYVASRPLLFADEFSVYLYMAIVYLGLAHTARTGGHISVDYLGKHFLSNRGRAILELLTLLAALVVTAVLFWFALGLFAESVKIGRRAQTIVGTPLWIPQTLLWLGLLLLGLEIAISIVKKIASVRETGGRECAPLAPRSDGR